MIAIITKMLLNSVMHISTTATSLESHQIFTTTDMKIIMVTLELYIIGRGPGGSTRPPRADSPGPIFFCSLDPSKHEKLMPPSPNWDELPT